MAGVNYLDKNMASYLKEPIDSMFDNDDASAVGHVYQKFADQGTSTWHRRTTEWFLVCTAVTKKVWMANGSRFICLLKLRLPLITFAKAIMHLRLKMPINPSFKIWLVAAWINPTL